MEHIQFQIPPSFSKPPVITRPRPDLASLFKGYFLLISFGVFCFFFAAAIVGVFKGNSLAVAFLAGGATSLATSFVIRGRRVISEFADSLRERISMVTHAW